MRRRINWKACRALAGLALAASLPSAVPASDAAQHIILFFGDSLTAGYGLADPDSQSYPAQFQRRIDAEHLPWRVVNAGLSGETSAGGLRRIDWVLRQPLDVFVLELGGNDGLRGTPTETTRANLQAIIDRVRSKYPSAKVILAGMRMPRNMGPEYAEAFRAIYPALAQKNGIALIPFLLDGVAGRPELNQYDGIHPTPEGASVIADEVWKSIGPVLKGYGK